MGPGVRGVTVATALLVLEITSIDIDPYICQQRIPTSKEYQSSVKVGIWRGRNVMGAFGIGLLASLPLDLLTWLLVIDLAD